MQSNNHLHQFGYLIDKIREAEFLESPFKHLIIDDFLSEEHFELISQAKEVNRPRFENTEELIADLTNNGFNVQPFPGCTNSVQEYLTCFNENQWPTDKGLLEGFGLTFRLKKYQTPLLEALMQFIEHEDFKQALHDKFELANSTYIETGIQKYLHGYEISPHPDVRSKAATYMLNINPSSESEDMDIHTYLMRFKTGRSYILDFWREHTDVERCWVPWDWCESEFKTVKNNSIILFSPDNDSMHAVKLSYDHLKFQRTQVYGNLWYHKTDVRYPSTYKDLVSSDIDLRKIKKKTLKTRIKSFIPDSTRKQLVDIYQKYF